MLNKDRIVHILALLYQIYLQSYLSIASSASHPCYSRTILLALMSYLSLQQMFLGTSFMWGSFESDIYSITWIVSEAASWTSFYVVKHCWKISHVCAEIILCASWYQQEDNTLCVPVSVYLWVTIFFHI